MNCPYCGKEMTLGDICARGGAGMYWMPQEQKLRFLVSNKVIEKHNGIVLVDVNTIGGVTKTAYVCASCKKMVIDFDSSR